MSFRDPRVPALALPPHPPKPKPWAREDPQEFVILNGGRRLLDELEVEGSIYDLLAFPEPDKFLRMVKEIVNHEHTDKRIKANRRKQE